MLCIEVLLSFCWRDVSDGAKQAPVVEPVDPAEGDHFQILHVAPRALAMNQLGFVETVYSFSEGVVVGLPDAADRWFNACFSQTLGIANGKILPAAIAVMNQSAFLDGPSIMQDLFQRIENKVSFGRPGDPLISLPAVS